MSCVCCYILTVSVLETGMLVSSLCPQKLKENLRPSTLQKADISSFVFLLFFTIWFLIGWAGCGRRTHQHLCTADCTYVKTLPWNPHSYTFESVSTSLHFWNFFEDAWDCSSNKELNLFSQHKCPCQDNWKKKKNLFN